MYVTLRGLAVAAVIVAIGIGGVYVLSRPGQTGQVAPSPTPSSSPDAAAQLAAYRAARDAVCRPAMEQLLALFAALPSGASTDEQAANLDQNIALGTQEIEQLAAIDAPPLFLEEHVADLQRHRDGLVLIQQVANLLHEGKQLEADAVDQAIAGLSSIEETFEQKYALAPCP